MSAFAFTMPTASPGTVTSAQAKAITRRDRLWGKDISYDVRDGDQADYEVTPAGDWATIEGRACLRQALIRRIITDPGEWQTLQDYGVGARSFVKAKNTKANRDELERRIRVQFLADPRVDKIEQIATEIISSGVKILVRVLPVGEPDKARPLLVSTEVT